MDKEPSTVGLEGSDKNEKKEETPSGEVKTSDDGRSSPEANCPICLGKPENKSFTDSCLHQFCFTCLLQWSKVKAECPLCKQTFKSIIHNVRSIEDYEQYYLSTAATTNNNNEMMGFFDNMPQYEPGRAREAFRYRTTAVSSYLEYFVRLEEAISNHVIPAIPTHSTPSHALRRGFVGTSHFRRNVYQQGLWVHRTRDAFTGRVRDCSPEFYRANPALLHRLAPWLNRELNVLLNSNEPHIQFVMSRILELITETPIKSARFATAVSTYIGRHTEHFVHEFYNFASSPYDLTAYDRYADYVGRNDVATLDESETDSSDSDVQVVSILPPSSPPRPIHLDDSDDCVVVDNIPPRQPSPEVITLESDADDDVVQVNIHIETDNNRPESRRTPLKKRWLKLKNVHMEKCSTENVNVSINIAHSSRTKSPSPEDSASSHNPSTSKSTKSKGKLNKSKKSSKSKSSLTKNKSSKSKAKTTKKVNKEKSLSSVRKRKTQKIKSSSEEESDSDKLQIVTDHYSSSSSSDESYKPKLRSVVVKSTQKRELDYHLPTRSASYWNERSHVYSSKSETDDAYGPSCSHHSNYNKRSSSAEYKPDSKSKYSLKRFKREAYW